uniref:tether containing UBX domain for GLUT4 isoform X2 n=1 Tax=Myxine glutinosa TaxID=7769 RepID=UPI00358FDB4B
MAATMVVSVLTPTGRRQTVRVNANTLMLQILEEVCNKHDLNPDEYDLKFQHRVLRPSEQIRYSNLPNNAKLEMVAASHPCSSEHQVRIALQLPDGARMQDVFSPRHKLWDVIMHFPQSRVLCMQTQDVVPGCVYMQNEYAGEEVLKKTTLKILGLIGGSAAIRFIQIKAPVLGMATDDSSRESAVPKTTMQEPCHKVTKVATMCAGNSSDAMEVSCSEDGSPFSSGTCNTEVPLQVQMGTSFVPFSGSGRSLAEPDKTVQIESSCAGGSPASVSFSSSISPSSNKPCDRQALVIIPDRGLLRSPSDDKGLPDEFFEVTVEDVRRRYTELKKARLHLEEAPLLTSEMRERQKHERLKHYSQVVIRVNFPDRFVLQGFFGQQETVRDLQEFVETHLEEPGLPFYLYTAPPRHLMIDASQTLFEANLLPTAVVHFGSAVKTEHNLSSTCLRMAVPRLQADMLVDSSIPRVVCKNEAVDSAVVSTNEPGGSGITLPSLQDNSAIRDPEESDKTRRDILKMQS